jgi:Choline/Carnitine o-acyltransferase
VTKEFFSLDSTMSSGSDERRSLGLGDLGGSITTFQPFRTIVQYNRNAADSSRHSSDVADSGEGAQDPANNGVNRITFRHQRDLPRLPIPSLEDTLNKFPSVIAALQNEEERQQTLETVEQFRSQDGPVLQKLLVEYATAGMENGTLGSYVEEFWNESYLAPDTKVVLNLNPYFVLEDGPDPKISSDQLRHAASLCHAAIRMTSMLRAERLPPDTFRGKPLCMDQFHLLFGASRQPRPKHEHDDILVCTDSRHGTCCSQQIHLYMSPLLFALTLPCFQLPSCVKNSFILFGPCGHIPTTWHWMNWMYWIFCGPFVGMLTSRFTNWRLLHQHWVS